MTRSSLRPRVAGGWVGANKRFASREPRIIEPYLGDTDSNRVEIDALDYPFNEKVGFPPLDRTPAD